MSKERFQILGDKIFDNEDGNFITDSKELVEKINKEVSIGMDETQELENRIEELEGILSEINSLTFDY